MSSHRGLGSMHIDEVIHGADTGNDDISDLEDIINLLDAPANVQEVLNGPIFDVGQEWAKVRVSRKLESESSDIPIGLPLESLDPPWPRGSGQTGSPARQCIDIYIYMYMHVCIYIGR